MNMDAKIEELRVVPVVVLNDVKDAVPLAKALIAGGLPVAEVTFRTDAAERSIQDISAEFPDMIVGAGTITSVEQAKRAIAAGAKFLVTPGFSDEVTAYAVEHNVPIYPGICTPTELMAGLKYNLKVFKFFPASQYGGLSTIKALSGPFPGVRFMPTGGISVSNLKEYLSSPKVIACGGSWMVKGDLIAAGKFDEIERLTREAVALTKEV